MFCQDCGSEISIGAKFCGSCGKAVDGYVAAGVKTNQMEERIFLSEGTVLVSDAVFRSPSGVSYPVRNISSVSIERGSATLAAVLGTLFVLMGLAALVGGGLDAGVTLQLFIGTACWIYFIRRPYFLKIGAGGVLQTAIESTDGIELDKIARAINDAILHLQRGGRT